MPEVCTHHKPDLNHHVRQGSAWLVASNQGQNTAALSYSAFELRFAVERLAVHYWAQLLDRKMEADDLLDIESFKTIERRIYELGGHQRKINEHFRFMRVVLGAMKIDMPLYTPDIGALSRYWSECSNLCHIAWPLSCALPEVTNLAFTTLQEIVDGLAPHVESLGWPIIRDPAFAGLRGRFIAGDATEADVLAHVQSTGIWARVEYPDGRPSVFVGEAVEPNENPGH